MAAKRSDWHMVLTERETEDDEPTITAWLHPDTCQWSVTWHPRMVDTDGNLVHEEFTERTYGCGCAWQHDEFGAPTFSEPGWWWVRYVVDKIDGYYWQEISTDFEIVKAEGPPS